METQQLQYKLSAFEGPLDLLLTLISKNKIDIYDISISELLDQYMEQINMMQENQMDIASEFLTMASRLVYIKSVMLLPKYEEEAEELKKELSGQLLEYAVCREMAAKLGDIYDFDSFYREASPVEFDLTYTEFIRVRILQRHMSAQSDEASVSFHRQKTHFRVLCRIKSCR